MNSLLTTHGCNENPSDPYWGLDIITVITINIQGGKNTIATFFLDYSYDAIFILKS